jgi:hypothetical protein
MVTSSPQTESETNVRTRYWSLVSCRRAPFTTPILVLLAVLAAGEASAGEDQDFEDFFGAYKHRIEGVTVGAGDASASNTAAQIINPWPVYSQDRRILSESQRMIGAIRRYHSNSGAKTLSVQNGATPETGAQDDPAATPDTDTSPAPNVSAGE